MTPLQFDRGTFVAAVEKHGSAKAAGRALGLSEYASRKHAAAYLNQRSSQDARAEGPQGVEKPMAEVTGDTARFVSSPAPQLGDLVELIRGAGLDPDEWEIARARVNRWDSNAGEGSIITLHQLRAELTRKVPLQWLFPASEVQARWTPPRSVPVLGSTWLEWIGGDHQAPYHDEALHQAKLRWLADVQPDGMTYTGDTVDLPTISRHADRPNWSASPQTCLDAGYRILSDDADAAPNARKRKLRGNHDWRIEAELLSRAERMFGLQPASIPGTEQVPGYSIRRLLHLDALGIELVGREGDDWKVAEVEIVPGLVVRHRPPNQEKMLRLGRNVVAGDTHKQSIRGFTTFVDDQPEIRWLVQAGCLCLTDGLGYTEHPDWQPGFATAAIAKDGTQTFELAVWRNGKLTWRGQSW